jgi:hypothetical protein
MPQWDAVEGGNCVGSDVAVVDPDLLHDAAHVRFEVKERDVGGADVAGAAKARAQQCEGPALAAQTCCERSCTLARGH